MIEWFKNLKGIFMLLIGAITILVAIIPLFSSKYLDQYIMLLTLLGLIVNNLGKENSLYKIRFFLGELFLFLAKAVSETSIKTGIFALFGLIVIYLCSTLGFIPNIPQEIFSKKTLPALGIYIGLFSAIIIFFYIISSLISKFEASIDNEEKEKILNVIYYGFLFTLYLINCIYKYFL